MKKIVLIFSAVLFLAATGVFILGQNAFAEDLGIRITVPENLQEVEPGDLVTVSGVVDGVSQLNEDHRLSVRVGRHMLPLQSKRNKFSSEFEVSKTIPNGYRMYPRHRMYRRHGVIYIWGRVKINGRYYFDKVKLRVKRDQGYGYGNGHRHGQRNRD